MPNNLNVAVVHSSYQKRGGAERVAEVLAETFDAPLVSGFVNEESVPADRDFGIHAAFNNSIFSSVVNKSGFFRELYAQFAWQYRPELAEYDVLIQTAPQPGWYVPTQEQVVVRYTHDLPRTVYDRFQLQRRSRVNRLYTHVFRVLYYPYVSFPDRYVANSELVARRLERYWDIEDASVVYPPVNTEPYRHAEDDGYYLTYSRLAPRKRVDEIIEAFSYLPDKRLIVGGSGSAEADLRSQAAELPNVCFKGYLSEERKVELLSSAKALIFAAEEESFGMVPVEAFASGKPVIGIDSGFTRHQIRDGQDGILYDRGARSLADAISDFERDGVSADPRELMEKSEEYSVETFRERMVDIVTTEANKVEF